MPLPREGPPRKYHADFNMLKVDTASFQLVQYRYPNIAAGKIIIGPIHHAVRIIGKCHQKKERNKEKSTQSRCTDPAACAAEGKDGQRNVIENSNRRHDAGDLKNHAAEVIVQGKLPCRVNMPVQENALSDLSCALSHGCDIDALLFREERVYRLPVEYEVEQEQNKRSTSEKDTQPWANEKAHSAECIEGC